MTETKSDSRRGVRALITAVIRFFGDVVILGLWVLFLTLLFLSTGWPIWAFYGLLLLGVAVYVSITASWFGSSSS
ncbi:hypothetical protein HALLA_08895 [Halostagnicola larsenii XH-48]|uniref:DUF8119 domain-containing protein n=1 Tax=Halostagnicola larsenii XH-48 TaxID=797299 RepID=W0JPQ9_9EURY|nr:hypothetical protein [Halostagnicola larsenii]AHF98967.1 hypothetical protein HALLA_08895 [Halostagnicola larsenii XH-48]